ncbi:FAD-dependent oxidoreductase [Nocardiopsis sediminis]|uniref:FAD-dependent oxidoreductase n=1 Tax=Nocardiopsis sediminis TaxID=1778267 RepID=A0ABV8FGV7_9ACTN
MRALVIGAGIGGPVAAVALRRAGIDAVVHEAHAGPAASLGSFLNIAPNGLAALDALGILGPVLSAADFPTSSIEMRNGKGRHLGTLSDGSADLGPGLRTVTIMRGRLQEALSHAAADNGVGIEYGRRLTGVTDTGSGVVAHFTDGGTSEGDVLIGADGIHSPVRAAMYGAAGERAPRPEYTGLLNIGGVTPPLPLEPTPEGTIRMTYGRRAFFGHQTAPDGRIFWFTNFPHPRADRDTLTSRTPEQWRDHVIGLFTGDHPDITAILRASPVPGFTPDGIHDIAGLPYWSRGRVGLLGDAAHAVSSSSGQGASLAVEDAVTVAACLRDVADPASALQVYEALRRDRVGRIVAEGRRRGRTKLAAGPLQTALRDLVLPVVFRAIAARKGHSWIFDHRIDFEARVDAAAGGVSGGVSGPRGPRWPGAPRWPSGGAGRR